MSLCLFPVPFVQVFKELLDFDVSDAFGIPKDDGHFWWPGLSSKRRRRSSVFPWHWDITKDARFAFTVRARTCPQSRRSSDTQSSNLRLCVCVFFLLCMFNSGNGAGGDDRRRESEPPADWRHVHRRGRPCFPAAYIHCSGCHAPSTHNEVKDLR